MKKHLQNKKFFLRNFEKAIIRDIRYKTEI